MRQYLKKAFKYFEYRSDDAELLLDTYDRIFANSKAAKVFLEGISIYEHDYTAEHTEIIKLADKAADMTNIHRYTAELLILICMTKHAKEIYIKHGYSEEIYKNTFLDLRYKLEECKAVKGIVGIFTASWFYRFFNLTRFALGRLQFELISFEKNYEKDGKVLFPESKVINVHIPKSGIPLTPQLCDEAFLMAKEIFKTQINGYIAFVCHSWLLYPKNAVFLSPSSNTYKFMKRFDIIESEIDKDGNDLWRLFDTDEKNPRRLPSDSSMRRAYVEHLKRGGSVGCGFGVFFA